MLRALAEADVRYLMVGAWPLPRCGKGDIGQGARAHARSNVRDKVPNVTSKGQVTIPKEVRERLGIAPGSAVTFELTEAGGIVLRAVPRRAARPAVRTPRSRFPKLRGRATVKMRTEEILALTRGGR